MKRDVRISQSITDVPQVSLERMRNGHPILEPNPVNDWESTVVLNAASVLVTESSDIEQTGLALGIPQDRVIRLKEIGGMCVMLYRAQGTQSLPDGTCPSSIGLAVFTPELELVFRNSRPVLGFDMPHRNLGAEDPRCTRIGDAFYLFYTGYRSVVVCGKEDRGVRICVATSTDLVHWNDYGPVAGDINAVDNKNPALLPVQVADKWLLLHRPMEGPDAMTIHIAVADSPLGPWYDREVLMTAENYREFSKSWIGAAGPPLHLDDSRFLMVYHLGNFTHEGKREYDLGAALLDFSEPDPLVSRIEPVLRPEGAGELRGDKSLGVDNVVFSCANYIWNDELIVPYAGADSRIFGAKVGMEKLRASL